MKPPPPEIDERDLLAAVESLYQDKLKPFGRLVRKRLNERGVALSLESGEGGLAHLRTQCEKSSWLVLGAAQGGEWVALLVGCQPDFVDFYSPVDIYPSSLWSSLEEYFERVTGSDAVLPSGRFSCAQALLYRGLPCLRGQALGSVCHIVQLAISQKKLLGYSSEGITPYQRSQSMLKEKAARQQASLPSGEDAELPLASWKLVRSSMIAALQSEDGTPTPVPLSNIKRMFRTRFNAELCETALGHSKVSELLQDPRLEGVCTVKLLEQGYFIVPLFDKCPSDDDTELPSGTNSDSESTDFSCDVPWLVRNTFIDTTPPRASPRRSKSVGDLECTSLFLQSGARVAPEQVLPAAFQSLGFVIRNTFIETPSNLAACDGHKRSQSARRF